jgi:hypothetical protein
VSRGYGPILNNLVSAQLGRPITVMNEGMAVPRGVPAPRAARAGSPPQGKTYRISVLANHVRNQRLQTFGSQRQRVVAGRPRLQ